MSYMTQFDVSGVVVPILTLTGDSGGAVSPTAGNIDLLGGNNITTTGNPGASTITIDVTGTTQSSLQIGNASGSLTSLGVATDGQLPIGSTGLDPVLATLTAGTGVSIVNAAGSITVNAAGVDQITILYVGKHGNDANDGLTIDKAFLTFGAAIAAASAGDTIWCFDQGIYTENLTGVAQVTIFAPNATLVGAHSMAGNDKWTFSSLVVATATTGITYNSVGLQSAIFLDSMVISGTGIGVVNLAGRFLAEVKAVSLVDGFFIGNTTADQTFITFQEVMITGTGTAFGAVAGGELHISGGVVTDNGVGTGTVFFTTGAGVPEIDAIISHIDIDELSDITAASDVRLTCSSVEGLQSESGTGLVTIGGSDRIDNVPIGAVTPSTGDFTTITTTTPIDVAYGGTGISNPTDHSLLVGSGAAALTELGVATDGQLPIGSSGADPVLANITSTTGLQITNGAGSIDITLDSQTEETAVHGWNGSLLETAMISVTSDGATITFSVEQNGGGDLTAVFSDGFYAWDTTPPDTVTLTAGADTSPQINYVYLLQSTKTLTAATGGWPATEHAPLATVLCQSAASLQADGAYKVHAWTDHVIQTSNQGHINDLNFWIRQQNATWVSGVAQTLTITPNGGSPDNVIFTSASGVVLQLHNHAFPAFSGTPDIYTVNDFTTPYNIVTDLNALLTDSTGASMAGRFFSLVIWGVVSEDGADCKLMVNLPGGSYATSAGVTADDSKFTDFNIPSDFVGTGFLIAQYNLRHQAAAGGTWTEIDFLDLRGLFPSIAAGSATAAGTEFVDNTFRIVDDGDGTKQIAFQASSISTATTRTMTVQDADGIIALSGVANYGTGVTSNTAYAVLCGGTTSTNPIQSVASVGTAGQVLTSNGAGALPTFQAGGGGGGITWNEETGTSATMSVDNGYIANNASLVTLTLPDTAALGSVVRVAGKGAGGWRVAQNAGETIHFGTSSTTTGATGYIEFTEQYDAVELVCITADTDWVVISSIGNLTVA